MKKKKTVNPTSLVVIGIIIGILVSVAVFMFGIFPYIDTNPSRDVDIDTNKNVYLTSLAYGVLENIRDNDFIALSQIAHPEYGVVFTPYATINLSTDRRFSAEQLAILNLDTHSYIWGVYNGSGEPIELTVAEYFNRFIPAGDYLDASVVGVNRIVKSGNALENITDVFPDVKFVDFHIPGGDRDTPDEYSWSSLRLGFEEYESTLRLVVIVHSAWTA